MSVLRNGSLGLISALVVLSGCSGDEPGETAAAAPAFSVFAGEDGSSAAGDGQRPRSSARPAESGDRNRVPMVRSIGIERVEPGEDDGITDEVWRAVVSADDPDGDSLSLEYHWYVNGKPVDDGSEDSDEWGEEQEEDRFLASRLSRGDRLQVEVRAFDGSVYSPRVRSGAIEVGNSPPVIVSTPPRPDALGNFRYAIRAEDGDGGAALRFELREGPDGMTIDEETGVVSWRPTTEQAGRHSVEVAVVDEDGAEATQAFSLALVLETEDPGPAAPR